MQEFLKEDLKFQHSEFYKKKYQKSFNQNKDILQVGVYFWDKDVHLQMWGWEIVLNSNGTYHIADTSGG